MVVETHIDLNAVEAHLRSFDLGVQGFTTMAEMLPDAAVGVVVYGSRARQDHHQSSDLDVLVVVEHPRGSVVDRHVTVSYYTPHQLSEASGTLFGSHLFHDAIVVHDSQGWTERTLASLQDADPKRVLDRIQHFRALLEVARLGNGRHLVGRVRLARYLLRSALYARAIEAGRPCFSVRQLASTLCKPALVDMLAADVPPTGRAGDELLRHLEEMLQETTEPPAPVPYQSLAELVLTEWETDRDRAVLGALVLGGSEGSFDYAQLPKVLL